MTAGAASATVVATPGCEVLQWRCADLRRATRYNAKLEVALEAIIAQDIARKLASSRPFEQTPPEAQPDAQPAPI